MVDTIPPTGADAPVDASAATDREGWLSLMEEISEDSGYFEPLGTKHWAFFHDESPTIIVTFEQLDDIRAQPGQMPRGHAVALAQGWSHLCIVSDGPSWYRDPAIYGYFDRLVDDAFFEDFDRVLFYGTGQAGYAACAYAVTAPGSTVLAISPRATQNPAQAGWDRRTPAARRLDFTSRYGYAPDMIDGCGAVFVMFDPTVTEDAMHAALFRASHVTMLRTPYLANRIEEALTLLDLLPKLITSAATGKLTPQVFAALWRKRRDFGPYLRGLLGRTEGANHTRRAIWLCRSVTSRMSAPRFKKRLAELEARENAGD